MIMILNNIRYKIYYYIGIWFRKSFVRVIIIEFLSVAFHMIVINYCIFNNVRNLCVVLTTTIFYQIV